MADDPATTPIVVDPSAAQLQIKGQVRIILAALAGALIGKHILPAFLGSDTVLDAVAALIMIGIASAWQWARVRLQHSRLWQLAINPRVPSDLARPADPVPAIGSMPVAHLFTQGEATMSLKTFTIQVEEAATAAFESAMAALKSAGHIVETFVVTETQKLVAEAKALPVGTLAMNIISALEAHTSTGEEKMAALIGAVTPALSALKAAGGLKGLETSVENFAKEFAQSSFNDFRAAAAAGVLHLNAPAPAPAA